MIKRNTCQENEACLDNKKQIVFALVLLVHNPSWKSMHKGKQCQAHWSFLFTDNCRGWCDSVGLNCYTLIIYGLMNVWFDFKICSDQITYKKTTLNDLFQLSKFMFLIFVQQVNLIVPEFSLFVFGFVNFKFRGYSTQISTWKLINFRELEKPIVVFFSLL